MLISRVLTNLLENAIRHGPKDTPITIGRGASRRRTRSPCSSPTTAPASAPSGATRSSACSPAGPATPGAGLGLSHRQDVRRGPRPAHLGGRTPPAAGPGSASRCRSRHWIPEEPQRGRRFSSLTTIPPAQRLPGRACRLSATSSARPRPGTRGWPRPRSRPGRHRARPGPARPGRRRGLQADQDLERRAPIVVLSADGSEDRKVEALEAGRRRLHDQAVRHARAQRPAAGGAAPSPRPRPGDEPDRARCPAAAPRPGPLRGHLRRPGPRPDAQGVRVPGLPGPERGQGLHPADDPGERLGPGYADELHYLKVYAYRIRRKLGDEDGRFLQSDPSVGYRLAAPAA